MGKIKTKHTKAARRAVKLNARSEFLLTADDYHVLTDALIDALGGEKAVLKMSHDASCYVVANEHRYRKECPAHAFREGAESHTPGCHVRSLLVTITNTIHMRTRK